MLSIADLGGIANRRDVTPSQDAAIRRAFGRCGDPHWRGRGAAALSELARERGGRYWLVCDCRQDAVSGLSPVMIPVEFSHIRRHDAHAWPPHATSCDFFLYREEQDEVAASYQLPDGIRLPDPRLPADRAGAIADQQIRPELRRVSLQHRRPLLAQIMARLLTMSGVQSFSVGNPPLPVVEQFAAIRAAARQLEISAGEPLEAWLRTAPVRYNELLAKIAIATGDQPRYGYIMGIADDAVGRDVYIHGGEHVRITGHVARFDAQPDAESGASPPYLFIALAARAVPGADPSLVRAYLHPLVSSRKNNLMIGGGETDRLAFGQIFSALRWVKDKRGLEHHVTKPLFPLRPRVDAPPALPDFVVSRGHRQWAILVTGSGGQRPQHERKAMEAAFPGHLLECDFTLGGQVDEIKKRFRKALIAAVLNENRGENTR